MPMQISIDRFLRSEKSHPYNLTAYDRVLLFILASYIGKSDDCFPSIARLIKDCGMSKNTIIRSIKKLELLNLLCVTRNSNNSNIYELMVPDRDHEEENMVPMRDHAVPVRNHAVPDRDPNNNINNINNNKSDFVQKNENKNLGSPLLQDWKANRQEAK